MEISHTDYDAVVVGSGPNGLAAAITLQRAGLSVLLLEAKSTIGGGMRTEALTLPGFLHDVCSAIHPMAAASPFLQQLPLDQHGLEYIHPPVCAAHPLDNGNAAILERSFEGTADSLGADADAYRRVLGPIVRRWPALAEDALGPLRLPSHPLDMARFGLKALAPAQTLARRFRTNEARGLWAGMAAHSLLPLDWWSTSAIGLVLMTAAHTTGWPIAKDGSASIAEAMASYFQSLGGVIETNTPVKRMGQLPSAGAVLFDVTPRQLLAIAGHRFTPLYKRQLERYRYGPGVFKVDWALDGPIPFINERCRRAGTVHLGGTFEEIARGETEVWKGRHTDKPFVLLAQQSLFDPTRAPGGKHTAYAYCHVPNGSVLDRTDVIERQVERFAPGFRELILARHTMDTAQLESYNANYIGGDINGGALDIRQLFTRPALRSSPYTTSARGIYLCSASTPPGGGVHGLCGYHAARRAIADCFSHRVVKHFPTILID
ncbi:MAG TPA: NAD(P)/FAD-dependent oxidoreductase [Dinghuibacter sp.]|uniref:phytoene desaturase family protein n=1 Tax=Dinghuibacter sp. TaxID=2024697 RepID=UPI002BB57994|nr:NAD(P)/FAD-dependent oxidoreductase [Dinghuibacter sp.]HTJ14341.1 NAD(P)/FAD-dependent oxidoreductase [Dinghuibacter sp.]